MKFLLSILSVLIITSSCVTVEFTEPQPAGKTAEISFPEELQGTYLMAEYQYSEFKSLDTLIISPFSYTAIFANKETHKLIDLPEMENIEIRDSLVFRLDKNPDIGYPFTVKDSAITYSFFEKESAFLSDSMVFKSYKGEYYLSLREDSREYTVILMKPERNGDIGCWSIDLEKDIDLLKKSTNQLKEVLKENGKIDKYIASPKAKELHKFNKSGGFSELLFRLYRIQEM